jgi:GDP-L-fucose synthase
MNKNSKIYIAGHTGLAGSAILRYFKKRGYSNLLTRTHEQLDLLKQSTVRNFMNKEKPEYVIIAAATVGGVIANNTYPAQFIYENLLIEINLIHEAFRNKVKKLLFLGSSCIYPRQCPQPMKEKHLLTGTLEPTNEPYAIAKIAGIKLCQSYNRQYGTNFIATMPTNLYGTADNYDLETSHVIPALLQKFHQAKVTNQPSVTLWGTGSPVREFLHSDDMADACHFLMLKYNPTKEQNRNGDIFLNMGTGIGMTVKELARLIQQIVGYQGELKWDKTMPDGMPKKVMDVSRLTSLGWQAKTTLPEGLTSAYQWYVNNIYDQDR